MKLSADEYRSWKNKSVTLLGMSGVGKTRLSSILLDHHWYHYSGDYRIGTYYMDEAILDNIKQQAMQVPFLRDLLRSDSIYIRNNITVDHLKPLSTFIGMLGNPELGGLPLSEFRRRQALHLQAEISAMLDVPHFMAKARKLYGYDCFINDPGGSVCELEHPGALKALTDHTLIIYMQANAANEDELVRRTIASPKPMYYRPDFLNEHLNRYMREQGLEYSAQIDPVEFVQWVFPLLFRARVPRYEDIAKQHGYTVSTDEIHSVRDESDFNELVANAIARKPSKHS